MAPTYSEPGEPGTLNVLLHGTFVFVADDARQEIHVLIPKIDTHVYRAGNWLGETDMRPGLYELKGAKPGGRGRLSNDQNLIVKRGALAPPEARFATLIFPFAKEITSLRVAAIPRKESFVDSNDDIVAGGSEPNMEHVANLQVLTFEFDSDCKLLLRKLEGTELKPPDARNPDVAQPGHYWEPVFTGDYINLHIFAAEDHAGQPSHVTTDFDKSMELLGSGLKLKHAHPVSGINPDKRLPDGIIAEETEDLAPRTGRMARLGRLQRQQGDPGQAWFGNDALDSGDPPACGSKGTHP